MRHRILGIVIVVAIMAAMVHPLDFVIRGPRSWLMGFDSAIHRRYEQIEIGDSKSRAIQLLGEPISNENSFSHEIAGRESEFSESELAQCVEFITWRNGGNWFYCIGVNEAGKIVIKADGHG